VLLLDDGSGTLPFIGGEGVGGTCNEGSDKNPETIVKSDMGHNDGEGGSVAVTTARSAVHFCCRCLLCVYPADFFVPFAPPLPLFFSSA
jgi:hypothetical protein